MGVWNCKCRKKQNREILSEKLGDHEKDVENKIDNIQTDIVKFWQEMIVDYFCVLEERLGAKNNEIWRTDWGSSNPG